MTMLAIHISLCSEMEVIACLEEPPGDGTWLMERPQEKGVPALVVQALVNANTSQIFLFVSSIWERNLSKCSGGWRCQFRSWWTYLVRLSLVMLDLIPFPRRSKRCCVDSWRHKVWNWLWSRGTVLQSPFNICWYYCQLQQWPGEDRQAESQHSHLRCHTSSATGLLYSAILQTGVANAAGWDALSGCNSAIY